LPVGRVEVGQRSETVRRANLSAIVRGLHDTGPMSRSQLVAATGLTRTTIRGLVGELVAAGLVEEKPAIRHGTPGRPSPLVRIARDAGVVLAIEALVDSLTVATVGLDGRIIAQERVTRPREERSVDAMVAHVADMAEATGARTAAPIAGVGVAVAGVVRRRDGLVAMAPNLGWVDEPFGERLVAALGMDVPVVVANDADLGALAEHRRGAGVGVDDLLYVSGEVGVGGGVISGGRPLDGFAGYGGEIGHIPINPGGSPCRCGSIGCWETEVGEGALLSLAGLSPDAGRAGIDAVLREAEAGNQVAVAALEHVGRWLAVGLAGLVNILNPQLIVLGSMHGRIYPAIRHTVEAGLSARALPAPRAVVRIVPATLGADAPLIGAAELALEPILADPAGYMARPAPAQRLASAS
jgi:predicted NBD/HSP70 family sugar kinase